LALTVSQPNVVIMIADDLTWHDVSCYGPTEVGTPNIDRMAAEGLRLTEFHGSCSVCAPCRANLLTGLYPFRNGCPANHGECKEDLKSLPGYLKGYETRCFGKLHVRPPEVFKFGAVELMDRGETIDMARIGDFFRTTRPFFAYIAFAKPHAPWKATGPEPATVPPYLVDTPATRNELSRYYAEVRLLDQQVGEVLDRLEKSGKSKNTLVFFFSEQGSDFPHAKYTLYDPGTHAAAVIRWPGHIQAGTSNSALCQYVDILPTILEATGMPSAAVDGVSLMPVFRGATKCRDLVFSEHITSACGSRTGTAPNYAIRAVFDGRWKLIWNINAPRPAYAPTVLETIFQDWQTKAKSGNVFAQEAVNSYLNRPEYELYDHSADPWELHNVAGEHPEQVKRLVPALLKWMESQGDDKSG
jgi:uncharacterized sulfatase